jgi:hypothetical protein
MMTTQPGLRQAKRLGRERQEIKKTEKARKSSEHAITTNGRNKKAITNPKKFQNENKQTSSICIN